MSQHPLSCRQHHIRRNKSPGRRIVVAALEVVQPRLGIVDIPTVAERVEIAQRARQRAGARDLPAPAVIGVFYYGIVITVNQTDNVVLPVADIVVIRTVVVDGRYIAVRIVTEQ